MTLTAERPHLTDAELDRSQPALVRPYVLAAERLRANHGVPTDPHTEAVARLGRTRLRTDLADLVRQLDLTPGPSGWAEPRRRSGYDEGPENGLCGV